ncbi:MAG: hypothetical protein AB2806_09170 [Candidatus Thiodiazotropha sp.]
MSKQRFWIITGYDSTNKICEQKVKYGCYSDNQMKELIKCLTAKHALTDEEIISAYSQRKCKRANSLLLDVQQDAKPFTLSCGTNPHFHARVVEA